MQKEDIRKLFDKYREGTCTSEEKALIEDWYLHYARQTKGALPDKASMEQALDDVWHTLPIHERRLPRGNSGFLYIAAAVALFLLFAVGLYFTFIGRPGSTQVLTSHLGSDLPDFAASDDEAYLMLEDGSKINLDSVRSGSDFEHQHTKIHKTDDGILVYGVSPNNEAPTAHTMAFNTVNIPKTKQYQLVLPDGTKVWLNSLSTMRFPATFDDNERRVKITGEAYFEVAKDKARPFYVETSGMTVKVLGTKFNVNAYADEAVITTTLLSGSVELSSSKSDGASANPASTILHPGEAAQLWPVRNKFTVKEVDAAGAIAWKDGIISFNNADLKSIMRQMVRWYDVEVEYNGEATKRRFTGGISKEAPLMEFLRILELYDVKFLKKENKIIILPD